MEAESGESRDRARAAIESLGAAGRHLATLRASLEEEIAELSAAVASLQKGLLEAETLRNAEAAQNGKAAAAAEEGGAAVELALQVLSEFYNNAQLVQTGYAPPGADREGLAVSDRAPEIFEDAYHGDQRSSKGILGLLQVIRADFARALEAVKAEEAEASRAFTAFQVDAKRDISAKEEARKTREARASELKDATVENEASHREQEQLLAAALAALQALQGECDSGSEAHEERASQRAQELEALKEARDLLEGWREG